MAKNKFKGRFMAMPVEKNDTAAWANIEETKPVSNVNIPDEVQIRNAKEYVDTNQK
ncbi:MAG: CDIF630_02480 family spore surface protein [Bacillota bacterium]